MAERGKRQRQIDGGRRLADSRRADDEGRQSIREGDLEPGMELLVAASLKELTVVGDGPAVVAGR